MKKLLERPDGIIITVGQAELKEKGYRNWLRNYLEAMGKDDWTYWYRLGNKPKHEVMWVYICIGGKIRFRSNFVMYHDDGYMTFRGGKILYGKAWVAICGPVVRPDKPILRKGFQGFRYTHKLF